MSRDLDDLTRSLEEARPALDRREQALAVAIYRLLARGEPVGTSELAATISASEGWITERLERWPGVFTDPNGHIVGFWGLTIVEMPHRLEVEGRLLYTWCAWDPLFIVQILGSSGRVTSTCPATGRTVTMTVSPDGVQHADPGIVLSFLAPTEEWDDRVIEHFCHYVNLFSSHEAAETWTTQHPGTFVMSVADGFELGRRTFVRYQKAAS